MPRVKPLALHHSSLTRVIIHTFLFIRNAISLQSMLSTSLSTFTICKKNSSPNSNPLKNDIWLPLTRIELTLRFSRLATKSTCDQITFERPVQPENSLKNTLAHSRSSDNLVLILTPSNFRTTFAVYIPSSMFLNSNPQSRMLFRTEFKIRHRLFK